MTKSWIRKLRKQETTQSKNSSHRKACVPWHSKDQATQHRKHHQTQHNKTQSKKKSNNQTTTTHNGTKKKWTLAWSTVSWRLRTRLVTRPNSSSMPPTMIYRRPSPISTIGTVAVVMKVLNNLWSHNHNNRDNNHKQHQRRQLQLKNRQRPRREDLAWWRSMIWTGVMTLVVVQTMIRTRIGTMPVVQLLGKAEMFSIFTIFCFFSANFSLLNFPDKIS